MVAKMIGFKKWEKDGKENCIVYIGVKANKTAGYETKSMFCKQELVELNMVDKEVNIDLGLSWGDKPYIENISIIK